MEVNAIKYTDTWMFLLIIKSSFLKQKYVTLHNFYSITS
jgi:hypothetical protein